VPQIILKRFTDWDTNGQMNRKLLHKTQRIFLIYFAVIFIVAAPLFYFTIHKMYISNADESLRLRKFEFIHNNAPFLHKADIPIWNKYNPNVKILKNKGLRKDRLFYSHYYENQDDETELYRELNTPITIENKPYTLSARTNLVESEDLILSIAILFVIIIVLLQLGLYFFNKRLSQKLWQPFYQTLQQIEDFEIDKGKQPIFEKSDIEEFNRLNTSIHKLIERNIIIYKNQREFIDNAAHELQTPLAVFRSKLDLLMQRDDLTNGQAAILETIDDNINRLIKLNKNLLMLSKIERTKELKIEEFTIKALLEKQIKFFEEQANSKQIHFTLKIKNDISIKANKNLTEILFSNLLLNAVQHNIENGTVKIEVNQNKVFISNTSDLPEIAKDKLFNRFAKSNQNQQGNGLGLAIVKKIATIHKWQILYSFSKNIHKFTIQF